MTSSRWDSVIQDIRRMASLSGAANLPDRELLDAFVVKHDQVAFEVLVRRYGPMVFGVCKRILRQAQDAEDAFQATFLVLVRKASSLGPSAAVGNWLYGVAYRTALQARGRSVRRRHKEAEVPPMDSQDSTLETAARRELQALLDRELNRLPDKYRTPVILCDLLGKTKKQAAEELRCPEGTVSSRLARGREMLRKRLARYAPAFSAAGGVVLLEQLGTAALPAGLYSTTIKAAALIAKGTTAAAGLAPNVASLVEGVIKSMLITKLKPMMALMLVATLLGGVAWGVGSGLGGGQKGAAGIQHDNTAKVAPGGVEGGVAGEGGAGEQPTDIAPPKKEQFRYKAKDFAAWKETLVIELDPSIQIDAIKALGAFGVNGYHEDATAAILGWLKRRDTKETFEMEELTVIDEAENTFLRLGAKSINVLAKELDSKSVNDRRWAAWSYNFMMARACTSFQGRSVPTTGEKLRPKGLDFAPTDYSRPSDLPYPVRTELFKNMLPHLTRALKDSDNDVQRWVMQTISLAANVGEVSPAKLAASDLQGFSAALADALKHADPKMRKYAAEALAWLGPEAKSTVPALIKALDASDSTDMKYLLAKALAGIGPAAKDAVPVLIKTLSEKDQDSHWHAAIQALGRIGPAAKDAVPALINMAKSEDYSLEAIIAIGLIGPSAKDAVPTLIELLKDKHAHVRLEVVIALGNIGPEAKTAIPALTTLVGSIGEASPQEWIAVRTAATEALKKIGK
ncbi:MAG TPA: sigma-70 family RNA polymerase sigma factor [Gemmataceae bacterium]|nr:sigma-70 family RNA polymerase sigma factor [Gemmataceae bacterium]